MTDSTPIYIGNRFRILDQKLIELLRSLSPDDWAKPTTARLWNVKDMATHLLDTSLRTLSVARDGYAGDPPGAINSYADLLTYLNGLNADWVKATRRLSPTVLTALLEQIGPEFCAFMETLDPFKPAAFSVAWAGEEVSANWFHIAREYTEKWHHQQQIRLATGKGTDDLLSEELGRPFIETLMRALPFHYRNVVAESGKGIQFYITGDSGGNWLLAEKAGKWQFAEQTEPSALTKVIIPDFIAWRIFMKSIELSEAKNHVRIEGEQALGEHVLSMLSVMA